MKFNYAAYTVIWADADGTVIETDENVPSGTAASFDGTDPAKAPSAFATYTFAGWSPEPGTVTGNVTYTATYTSVHTHDDVVFTEWTNTFSMPTNSGSYVLMNDVTLNYMWSIQSDITINLCLNGHGIKKTGSGSVIKLNTRSTLNLYDCDTTTTRIFCRNYCTLDNKDIPYYSLDNNDTDYEDELFPKEYTVTGGFITGGKDGIRVSDGNNCGAGVFVDKNATFNMHGGTIIGNIGSKHGAGVFVRGGKFTMDGGVITGNAAQYGGVSVHSNYSGGTVEIKDDATITRNCAVGNSGGIHTNGNYSNSVEIRISGGTIAKNLSAQYAGVNIDGANSTLNLSGNPQIKDNYTVTWTSSGNFTQGAACNVYLNAKTLNVTGEMTNTEPVGISIHNPQNTNVFTASEDTALNDASKFASDNSGYLVGKNPDGQLVLGVPCQVDFVMMGVTLQSSQVPYGVVPVYNGPEPTLENQAFWGWYDGVHLAFRPGETLPVVTGDVTYQADFIYVGGRLAGYTLSLKSETTLSLYFESDKTLTFECEGKIVETVSNGKYQVARIRGIVAKELQNNFTLTVKEGDTVLGTMVYSPMTYCYNVLSDETRPEALQNVCKAFFLYAKAADTYFPD